MCVCAHEFAQVYCFSNDCTLHTQVYFTHAGRERDRERAREREREREREQERGGGGAEREGSCTSALTDVRYVCCSNVDMCVAVT